MARGILATGHAGTFSYTVTSAVLEAATGKRVLVACATRQRADQTKTEIEKLIAAQPDRFPPLAVNSVRQGVEVVPAEWC